MTRTTRLSDMVLKWGIELPQEQWILIESALQVSTGLPIIALGQKETDPAIMIESLGIAGLMGLALIGIAKGDAGPLIALMGTCTFIMFIYEEAMQTASFPINITINSGDLEAAEAQVATVEVLNTHNKAVIEQCKIASPLSAPCFQANADAVDASMKLWRARIEKLKTAKGMGSQGYDIRVV